jgi:cell division transport system ATP-binding protein
MNAISVNNVFLDLHGHPVFKNVSLQIQPGEFVYIMGQTGAGKSSFLRMLYMDLPPDRGTVAVGSYNSASITPRQKAMLRRTLGIVFQDYRLLDDRSVYDNVAFSLEVTGEKQNDIKRKVLRILSDVGLNHQRHKMPREISGGEQQRVVIARAMVNSPDFLLADEPTGNLDPQATDDIMKLLGEFNLRGTCVIMATHNEALPLRQRGRVLRIADAGISG